MANNKINKLLIPNISKLPGDKKVNLKSKIDNKINPNEFKNLLKDQVQETKDKHGIQLSIHAAKRLQERNMDMTGDELLKLKKAIGQLKAKGAQDSLIITAKGAYIVDVGGNKIVTAMTKDNMNGNVFTKIDSTLIVN